MLRRGDREDCGEVVVCVVPAYAATVLCVCRTKCAMPMYSQLPIGSSSQASSGEVIGARCWSEIEMNPVILSIVIVKERARKSRHQTEGEDFHPTTTVLVALSWLPFFITAMSAVQAASTISSMVQAAEQHISRIGLLRVLLVRTTAPALNPPSCVHAPMSLRPTYTAPSRSRMISPSRTS